MGDDREKDEKETKLEPGATQDDLIIQQHREIEKEICEKIKLVGVKENLRTLEKEYQSDDIYQKKVKNLAQKYEQMRRTRPDGNCFFRAFGFAYFEQLMYNHDKFSTFQEFARESKDKLISLGFPPFTLEDFHDVFMEVVNIVGRGSDSCDELYRVFNEQGYSDYVVVYLRLITSAHLQQNAEFYQNFIEGNRSIVDFCHQEVEPMYKESDHIHIIALSSELGVGVRVRYMDRGEASSDVIAHDFPDGSDVVIHLLYRPGHYDILYPISSSSSSSSSSSHHQPSSPPHLS